MHPPRPIKTSSLLLVAAFSCGLLSLPSQAQVISSDDFEDYAVGQNVGALPDWNAENRGGAPTIQAGNVFGSGNQYVEIHDTSTTGYASMVHTTNIAANQVVTFSLDFIALNEEQIDVGFASSGIQTRVLGSDRTLAAILREGKITSLRDSESFESVTYRLNTPYRLSLVVNDSGTTVNYADRSLPSSAYDVWIRELSQTESTYVGTGTFEPEPDGYYAAVRTMNAPRPHYYIDNWLVKKGADVGIPEPAAALLAGLASLVLLRRRR